MSCSICRKPVVLVPSAAERARKFGGAPSDYTARFPDHASCVIERNKAETVALMRRIVAVAAAKVVVLTS